MQNNKDCKIQDFKIVKLDKNSFKDAVYFFYTLSRNYELSITLQKKFKGIINNNTTAQEIDNILRTKPEFLKYYQEKATKYNDKACGLYKIFHIQKNTDGIKEDKFIGFFGGTVKELDNNGKVNKLNFRIQLIKRDEHGQRTNDYVGKNIAGKVCYLYSKEVCHNKHELNLETGKVFSSTLRDNDHSNSFQSKIGFDAISKKIDDPTKHYLVRETTLKDFQEKVLSRIIEMTEGQTKARF